MNKKYTKLDLKETEIIEEMLNNSEIGDIEAKITKKHIYVRFKRFNTK